MLQSTSQLAKLHDLLATEKCEWKFLTRHGPHFGGLWETAVKSMKNLLRRSLGSQVATYQNLCTLLAEIQASVISRYLCAFSVASFNPIYLCAGHIRIAKPLTKLPARDFIDIKCNRLSRWQTYQEKLQQFC